MFRKSNVNKTVEFFVYREFVTVKTAAVYKKLYFFSLKVLKARKRSWQALASLYYVRYKKYG